MALLRAFQKQMEKRPCPVCGKLVTRGLYHSHLNSCKLKANDDDCCIVAEVRAVNGKKGAIDNTFPANDLHTKPSTDQLVKPNSINTDHKEQEVGIIVQEEEMMDEMPIVTTIKTERELMANGRQAAVAKKRSKRAEASSTILSKVSPEKSVPKKQKSLEGKKATLAHHALNKRVDEIMVNKYEERCAINASVNCAPSVSHEFEMEKEESLLKAFEKIKLYLDVCECELSRNTGISLNNRSNINDDGRIGSPYYLTLFNKILKRVFSSGEQYSSVQFWGRHLYLLNKFIALSDKSKQLLVRLFLRKRKWLIATKLSYPEISLSLVPLFNELLRAELVDTSHSPALKIEEAVHLLHVPSLKTVAKFFKLDFNRGRSEICQSLLRFAMQKNVFGITMEKQVLLKIREELGCCFRLQKEVSRLFSAILTLYSPMDMSSTLLLEQPSLNLPSQLLFLLLQLGIDKVRFPAPDVPPLIIIYTDVEKLFRYIEAKELETEIAELMQRGLWAMIVDCARKARTKQYYESVPTHLRRFTDLHVYGRCISHGVEALERIRNYSEAISWLEYLLYAKEFELILHNARGKWWDRLALDLDVHLKDKDRAMKAVVDGLGDAVLGDKDRLLLQDRGCKLCSKWEGPLRIVEPKRVDIKGLVLGKSLGETRINRFLVEKKGITYECSVEEVALNHYIKKNGFKEGVHAEGTVWHTLFGLLFYDIIFDPNIENVWFSKTQMNPADLNSRGFYIQRQDLFELRFKEIDEANFDDLLLDMERKYNEHYGVMNSEISWDCFVDFEQIKRFMMCCPISVLCATIRRLVTDYRNCRSGFPDLTIWNDEKKLFAVVEVKGPGDKLSTKQRLWLNFFQSQNIVAHVCHVSAQKPRKLEQIMS